LERCLKIGNRLTGRGVYVKVSERGGPESDLGALPLRSLDLDNCRMGKGRHLKEGVGTGNMKGRGPFAYGRKVT